ncbi:RNA binding protein fox-1 homolog 1 [Striga asiatica]|uniref:RNA binding protein fox-1 homolog 1 n=1 Tax=Striga asiatica TaxID=4170 RepID=A0A5A7R4K1_STRAF|nr:RNA binding protein fox-1 homolog 1 [Striga asiatica]
MGTPKCVGQDEELAQKLQGFSLSKREHNFIDIAQDNITLSADECNRSLFEWQEGLSITHPIFSDLKLWVQVLNLPLNWLSTEVGLKIGTVFKNVDNVVVVGAASHGGKLMRLLVSIDINEALPRCANIRLNNQTINVVFKYEKLVNLLSLLWEHCHLDRGCSKRMEDIKSNAVKEGQFGDWMRAPEAQSWANLNSAGSRSPTHNDIPSPHPLTTPLHTLNSEVEESNQIIPVQVESSQNPTPTSKETVHPSTHSPEKPSQSSKQQSPLMMIERPDLSAIQAMDLETYQIPSPLSVVTNTRSQKLKLKSWKRSTSKVGRLLRQEESSSQIIKDTKAKRNLADYSDPISAEHDQSQKQEESKKLKTSNEKVEVASLEWHPSAQC